MNLQGSKLPDREHLHQENGFGRTETATSHADEWGRRGLLALPEQVAILDEAGTIVMVNRAWSDFAHENGAGDLPGVAVGANYLDVCRRAAAGNDRRAQATLEGILSVLDGAAQHFTCEYPCPGPSGPRWFLMNVTQLGGNGGGAIVSHLDISERKNAQTALRQSDERLRTIMDNVGACIFQKDTAGR